MKGRITRRVLLVGLLVALVSVIGVGCRPKEKEEILIGAPMPLTGPYASDGEQMKMALELAIEEKNAEGGVLGRPLKLVTGDVGGLEAEKIKAVGERLVGENVHAIITGYDDGGVDTHVFGEYDIPYLHGNAMSLCTQPVAENPEYRNVFQYTPNEVAYGVNAAVTLFEIPDKMGWTPPNNKVAIIKVDYAYNIMAADEFRDRVRETGYEVVVDEVTQFGVVEWGPILSKVEETQPAFVTFWNLDPTDAARFMIQLGEHFADTGLNALVFMQFTPTIPEFLELAGDAAEGLIWATTLQAVGDLADYEARWTKKFSDGPKAVYSYATRDAFEIWTAAVEKAGCVDCYDKVVQNIRETTYEGMCGTYKFDPTDQSILAGIDAIPTVWHQIWEGEHHVTGPGALKEFDYQLPPWIKP
ncbi:MAG: ABC transporter substrate-binding protein [Ardenticatenia bacterium]|nr:ABC transporter substrate-binding protein [Ardenticatenia bacterium]